MGTARFRKVTGSGSQRRHNNSLKLTALSRGLYLGGWGEAEAVKGTSQAKPRGSLVRPVRRTLSRDNLERVGKWSQ